MKKILLFNKNNMALFRSLTRLPYNGLYNIKICPSNKALPNLDYNSFKSFFSNNSDPIKPIDISPKFANVSSHITSSTNRKRVTILTLAEKFRKKVPITMVTAYDMSSALHGFDCLLVGDSVGMVALGYDNTLPVTMEEMIHHSKAVSRATKRPLLIGDMPFGSYESSPESALQNAIRFLKEANMDAIKLEGGKDMAPTIKKLVSSGVAVMGHIGLTPQRVSVLGGFRPQGRTSKAAEMLLEDALALQEAGCFAIVIECVPEPVAALLTSCISIPTIGIGSGKYTSGQVLVYHDLLGMISHPHHEEYAPRFCKQYAQIGKSIQTALNSFRTEVIAGEFPSEKFAPYKITNEEQNSFSSYVEHKFGIKLSDIKDDHLKNTPAAQNMDLLKEESKLPIIEPVSITVSQSLDKNNSTDEEILYSKKNK